jgi:hypothetical protein
MSNLCWNIVKGKAQTKIYDKARRSAVVAASKGTRLKFFKIILYAILLTRTCMALTALYKQL